MSNQDPDRLNDMHADEHINDDRGLEVEVLLTRIIDGEADDRDEARFHDMADAEPDLWRRLALRQQDVAALTCRVDEVLQRVDRVELPDLSNVEANARPVATTPAAPASAPRWMSMTVAFSGWAAMIIIALTWTVVALDRRELTNANGHDAPNPVDNSVQLTYEQCFQHYVDAPWVFSELQPHLLEVQELSDGRILMRFMRRIEEVKVFDSYEDVPVDEYGQLSVPASELREDEGDVVQINTNHDLDQQH